MFDIYSLAKPRVFMTEHDGGGSWNPGETPAPDSVEYESVVLQNGIGVISEEDATDKYPEAVGRVAVNTGNSGSRTINIINAASDFGGRIKRIVNNPFTGLQSDEKVYRTEFRPKQGLHNLDFTTPAETPSDNPGGDEPAQ